MLNDRNVAWLSGDAATSSFALQHVLARFRQIMEGETVASRCFNRASVPQVELVQPRVAIRLLFYAVFFKLAFVSQSIQNICIVYDNTNLI